ncbi:unnamed protein product [Rotaria sordida]|uniref:Uncharacterized protein n=1 Tax=Rotaria sordida TaxID=392033 RepID=A0A814H5N6_9BILA|nr:unnamed protein product [Rotaria sordida]
MDAARTNMAVVQPVTIPIPPAVSNTSSEVLENCGDSNTIDIRTVIVTHSTNEAVMDTNISIEEQELEYSNELNVDWIDAKIVVIQPNTLSSLT